MLSLAQIFLLVKDAPYYSLMTDLCRQGASQGGSAATRRGAQSEPHVSGAQEEGCSS